MKILRMNPLKSEGSGKTAAFLDIQTSDGIILSAESDRLGKISAAPTATAADNAAYEQAQRAYAQVQTDGRSRIRDLARLNDRSGSGLAYVPAEVEPGLSVRRCLEVAARG